MANDREAALVSSDLPEIVRRVRERTPARLLVGRAGAAYRTATQLELRAAHAAARDAVRSELVVARDFGTALLQRWAPVESHTRAIDKHQYLLRPDLGRRFDGGSLDAIRSHCPSGCDLQIAIGDGLSVAAVAAQVPALLPLLYEGAKQRNWTVGRAIVIHHCRVGILNEIGDLLGPRMAVLLIGERPGLATAESLSAYFAHRPKTNHTDADRHVISNIHARGLHPQLAASRILDLAARLMNTLPSSL